MGLFGKMQTLLNFDTALFKWNKIKEFGSCDRANKLQEC